VTGLSVVGTCFNKEGEIVESPPPPLPPIKLLKKVKPSAASIFFQFVDREAGRGVMDLLLAKTVRANFGDADSLLDV
jgi:hypothetical protein